MPLTEEQKKVRQKHFPGRRGFLPPDQMDLFRQLCADAGCPLEDGVYKRPRASPAGAKEEVPDWIPDLNPRSRKPKRKSDAVYSFDSSEGGRHGASYGHAAAAAAAFSAGMSDYDGDDLAAADTAHRGSGRNGLELGDVTSGSSGEDLTHKHTHLSALQVHLQQLQQQQQQQGHQRINDHGGFDPTAAAAAAVASAARDGVLISPQRSALHLQDPGFILGPQAAAAAAAAAAAEDDDDDADPAAAATAVDGEDLDADGMMEDRHPAAAAAAAMGREHRPSDDAVRSLMHLRASSPGDDDMPGSAAAAAAAAVAGRGSGELDHPTLAEFKQQQQQQQLRHFSPALAVSTGRGGRTGRPRGRPPTRGRGRGRGRVKRESEPLQVGSPLHPVGALYQHPNAAGVYHGSGGLGAATAQHYGGSFGGLGERVQGQSTLARLTHAAAMAEGMGTRGDRSRPDDYYQVYTEYFAAQEAYHRLMANLATHPMLHNVPEPEVPEKLYGAAYAGRLQDSTGMLAAAAAIDLLSPGSLGAHRRKKQQPPAAAAAAAEGAAAAEADESTEQDAAVDVMLTAAVAEQQQARDAVAAAARTAADAEAVLAAAADVLSGGQLEGGGGATDLPPPPAAAAAAEAGVSDGDGAEIGVQQEEGPMGVDGDGQEGDGQQQQQQQQQRAAGHLGLVL